MNPTSLLDSLYAAAQRAGLLTMCEWQPSDGSPPQAHPVGFACADESLMDGLTLSAEYAITYVASAFEGLAAREVLRIGAQRYVVREVRARGDGSERRASLSRV